MIEFFILGFTQEGVETPRERGMTTHCVQHVVDVYREKHPSCVRVCIDIAFPVEGKNEIRVVA